MLEIVGQFGLQYIEQTQGTLESLVATPSLLSRVIESQWQGAEIVFIRDRVQAGTGCFILIRMLNFIPKRRN